jgi:hypothetical protein
LQKTKQALPTLYYFKAFNLTIQSPFAIKGLVQTDAQPADINITLAPVGTIPAPLQPTNIQRKGLSATFASSSNQYDDCHLVWEDKLRFRLLHGKHMVIENHGQDTDTLSLFTISEPLGILLFQRGFILLHASAVTLPNGQAVIFMGEPGKGKSSTSAAMVQQGRPLLSDDLVAIQVHNDQPFVVPSFPQLKIWKRTVDGLQFDYSQLSKIVEGTNKYAYMDHSNFDPKPIPLRYIYELGASTEALVDKLHTPIELLKYFALPEQMLQSGPHLKHHFETCIGFAHHISIYRKPKMQTFDELRAFVNKLIASNT